MEQRYLALDLGASSGRGMLGAWDGSRVRLSETLRFENPSTMLQGHLYWDTLAQWQGVVHALASAGPAPDAIGIDTWGVDFGLLGPDGMLLSNALHYRDIIPTEVRERVDDAIGAETLYKRVGIAPLPFNTLYQLAALGARNSSSLLVASTLLPIADLFAYFLTGEAAAEATLASTTQMVDLKTQDWARDILDKLGLPGDILPPIQPAGALRGRVCEGILDGFVGVPVVAVGSHDTASAVAAIPAQGSFAYISSGTWSLIGTELAAPRPTREALAAGLTNELGVAGRTRLLKNVMGLWIIQECRRVWNSEGGMKLSYADIAGLAASERACASLIDPDHEMFLAPGNMPARIAEFCRTTRQPAPQGRGGIARTVFDSLALKYRWSLERLTAISGKEFASLYIVGGGSQNPLLNQLTADATGLPVYAGLPEATAAGNILVQAMALGELSSLEQIREASTRSFPLECYEPGAEQRTMNGAYERFCALVGGANT